MLCSVRSEIDTACSRLRRSAPIADECGDGAAADACFGLACSEGFESPAGAVVDALAGNRLEIRLGIGLNAASVQEKLSLQTDV